MSGVEALQSPEIATPEPPPMDFDKVAGDVWDRMTVNNGSDRGDDGRFVSPNDEPEAPEPQEAVESALEGADKGEVAETPDSSTPSEPSVPLPPNWRGKEDLWGKIPADIQSQLAEFQNEQHGKLTEQGRQLASAKPLTDAVNEFRHLFEGKIDPAEGIRRLASAQQGLENPGTRLQTIMNIIDGYGAREQLAAILTGRAQMPAPQPSQPQAPDIDHVVTQKVTEKLDLQSRERAIADFATANPLWSQMGEDDQYKYTLAARSLKPTASYDAVLKKAMDLAIEDNPALKAQVAAAAPKPPVATRQPSPEALKRANSVNVPSTSTGKVQQPSLDQALDAIWEKHHR